jgi:hypothetical protein
MLGGAGGDRERGDRGSDIAETSCCRIPVYPCPRIKPWESRPHGGGSGSRSPLQVVNTRVSGRATIGVITRLQACPGRFLIMLSSRLYQPLLRASIRLYSSSPSPLCASCAAPLPTLLPACPKCFKIERPIKKYDYYELLETSKSPNPFVINEGQLKNNFRRIQRYVHPDLWASQGEVLHLKYFSPPCYC